MHRGALRGGQRGSVRNRPGGSAQGGCAFHHRPAAMSTTSATAGQAHAVFLRSPHAHARITAIDTTAARSAPGVLAVYTGDDVQAAGLGTIKCVAPLKNRDGTNFFNPGRPLLATDKVRHVGDPVALVVADSLAAAKDALDLIEVDYADLAGGDRSRRSGEAGRAGAVGRAAEQRRARLGAGRSQANARKPSPRRRKIVTLDLAINRVMVAPIEPRGILAEYDPATERYHDPHRHARRFRHAQHGGAASRRQGRQGARHHRRCRRQLRHEDASTSRRTRCCPGRRSCSAGR